MDLSLAPSATLELLRTLISKPQVDHPTPFWELVHIEGYSKSNFGDGMKLKRVQAPPLGVGRWILNRGRTSQVRVKPRKDKWTWTGKIQTVDAAEALREQWIRRELAARKRRSIAKRAYRDMGKGLTDYLPKRPPSKLCFVRSVEDPVDENEDDDGEDADEEPAADQLQVSKDRTSKLYTKSLFYEFEFESEPMPTLATVADTREMSAEYLTKVFDDFGPFQAPEVEDRRADATRKPDDDGEEYADRFFNSATTFPDVTSETETARSDEAADTILAYRVDMPLAGEARATSSSLIHSETAAKPFTLQLGADLTRPLSWSSYLANLPPSKNLLETPLLTLLNRRKPGNTVDRTAVSTLMRDWHTRESYSPSTSQIHRDQASSRDAFAGLWTEVRLQ